MRVTFEADQGGFEGDEDALIWQVSGSGHHITLQRDSESSGEDWGIYLEWDDQANGGYECIHTIRLSPGMLNVDLSRQLGNLVGVDGFDVSLEITTEVFVALQQGLKRILRGRQELLGLGRKKQPFEK